MVAWCVVVKCWLDVYVNINYLWLILYNNINNKSMNLTKKSEGDCHLSM